MLSLCVSPGKSSRNHPVRTSDHQTASNIIVLFGRMTFKQQWVQSSFLVVGAFIFWQSLCKFSSFDLSKTMKFVVIFGHSSLHFLAISSLFLVLWAFKHSKLTSTDPDLHKCTMSALHTKILREEDKILTHALPMHLCKKKGRACAESKHTRVDQIVHVSLEFEVTARARGYTYTHTARTHFHG